MPNPAANSQALETRSIVLCWLCGSCLPDGMVKKSQSHHLEENNPVQEWGISVEILPQTETPRLSVSRVRGSTCRNMFC